MLRVVRTIRVRVMRVMMMALGEGRLREGTERERKDANTHEVLQVGGALRPGVLSDEGMGRWYGIRVGAKTHINMDQANADPSLRAAAKQSRGHALKLWIASSASPPRNDELGRMARIDRLGVL